MTHYINKTQSQDLVFLCARFQVHRLFAATENDAEGHRINLIIELDQPSRIDIRITILWLELSRLFHAPIQLNMIYFFTETYSQKIVKESTLLFEKMAS